MTAPQTNPNRLLDDPKCPLCHYAEGDIDPIIYPADVYDEDTGTTAVLIVCGGCEEGLNKDYPRDEQSGELVSRDALRERGYERERIEAEVMASKEEDWRRWKRS